MQINLAICVNHNPKLHEEILLQLILRKFKLSFEEIEFVGITCK